MQNAMLRSKYKDKRVGVFDVDDFTYKLEIFWGNFEEFRYILKS